MPSQPADPLPEAGGAKDPAKRPFAWRGTGHVLVADDEPAVRMVTARALERLGLTARSCVDGEEALATFREDPALWRLVVLDLTMPKMGGMDAAIAMRALRGDLPVILSSGYSADELTGRMPDPTRVAFLQKPFTVQSLSEAVLGLLGDS